MERHIVPSARKRDSSISTQLGMRSSKGDVGAYVPLSMRSAYWMYLEIWAPNTYMIHNMIMHCCMMMMVHHVLCFMVVFCGIHVINANLECCLQWHLHSYFGL